MLPPPEARRGDDPGPGGRLKEVNETSPHASSDTCLRREVQWKPAFDAKIRTTIRDTCGVWRLSFVDWRQPLWLRLDGGSAWGRIPRHGNGGQSTMIDDLQTIDALMESIGAALPMPAHVGRDVLRTLRRESPAAPMSDQCDVTEVRYAGDEGGILCTLDFDDHSSKDVYIVSITHVTFGRRNPLWRDIKRYKNRRIKRLRQLQGGVV